MRCYVRPHTGTSARRVPDGVAVATVTAKATKRLPRGIRNNNPGNIRKTPTKWVGEIDGSDDAFETFETPLVGIRALAKILLNYARRRQLNTVDEIIDRWAPPNENDTDAYVAAVALALQVEPTTVIEIEDLKILRPLVVAIIKHENGVQPYPAKLIDDACQMALAA